MISKLFKSILIIFILISNMHIFPNVGKIDKKKIAVELIKSIETRNPKSAEYVDTKKYIDHNQKVKFSIKGFNKVRSKGPKIKIKVNTVRAFEDGNFVFTHTVYYFSTPKIGIDIFRFENGKVVEHWGGLTQKNDFTVKDAELKVAGSTQISDLKSSKENKKTIKKFIDTVLIKRKYNQSHLYFNNKKFLDHESLFGKNFSSENMLKKNQIKVDDIKNNYSENIQILGEGNYVLAISEGTFACEVITYYDLFKLENNKIVEHWDVITPNS
ncbi:nuclear transport factor 2 family protein [Fluviispira multicolorata]|uniref:SnoaL-like domain-containing protein n=1 Tax=Fluviispira multicolorata TaxID=2654512 RepID=A0A833JB72_9BACT|nr:hypothetical protein [Fluviispira multicolorata]KAB8029037.1 hypothetical protein GCL57_10875 [Fluviispira multicolorata]